MFELLAGKFMTAGTALRQNRLVRDPGRGSDLHRPPRGDTNFRWRRFGSSMNI